MLCDRRVHLVDEACEATMAHVQARGQARGQVEAVRSFHDMLWMPKTATGLPPKLGYRGLWFLYGGIMQRSLGTWHFR